MCRDVYGRFSKNSIKDSHKIRKYESTKHKNNKNIKYKQTKKAKLKPN